MEYNFVDIACAIIFVLGLINGFMRGLSGELAHFVSLIVAFIASWRIYPIAGPWLSKLTGMSGPLGHALSFLGVLIGAFIFMMIVRALLRNILEFTFKGRVERVGGMLMGGGMALVLLLAAFLSFNCMQQPDVRRITLEESLTGRTLNRWLPVVFEDLSEDVQSLKKLPGGPNYKLSEDPDLAPILDDAPWEK